MAQDNILDFSGNDTLTQDQSEFLQYMDGDEKTPETPSKDITQATDEDIDEVALKAKQAEAKAKQAAEKQRIADEKKLFGEMDTEEEVEDDNELEETPKSTKQPKIEKPAEQDQPILEGVADFANDLYKTGILSPDNDDYDEQGQLVLPQSEEELVERLNWEKQKGAEQMVADFLGQHGPEWEQALRAIAVDGVHPTEYLKQFTEVQSFKDMDLADEDNQERVVRTALEKQGWEPGDIREEIKKLKTNADLETTAQRAHKALVKTEESELQQSQVQAKQRVEAKKAADARYATNLREAYSTAIKNSELDGIPLSKQVADKAMEFLEKPVFKLNSTGEVITRMQALLIELKNPHNAKAALQLAAMVGDIEPGKPISFNLKPIEKRAVSKESNKVFSSIKSKSAKLDSVPDETKGNDIDLITRSLR